MGHSSTSARLVRPWTLVSPFALLCVLLSSSSWTLAATDPQLRGGNCTACVPPCSDQCSAVDDRRIVIRPDCPCCAVCARRAGESCDESTRPCDVYFGLRCDNVTSICRGPFGLRATRVTHNSTILGWTSNVVGHRPDLEVSIARRFEETDDETDWKNLTVDVNDGTLAIRELSPNATFFLRVSDGAGHREVIDVHTEVGCVENGTSFGIGERYEVGCLLRCQCSEDGRPECLDRCSVVGGPSAGSTDCRIVGPDPDDACCDRFICESDSPSRSSTSDSGDDVPRVLLTSRTPDSLTIAWDDFKVHRGPNFESGYVVEYRRSTGTDDSKASWNRIQVGNVPITTVKHLHPATFYDVKVSIWEDVRSKRTSTEVAVLQTEDGCVWLNETVSVGSMFNKDCDSRCVCLGNDTSECADRCVGPARPASIANVTAFKSPVKAGCTFGNATYLVGETFFNGCEYKCRCNNNEGKYEMLCQPRCMQRADKRRLLDAACQLKRDPTDGCCKMLVCATDSENDADREGVLSRPRDGWTTTHSTGHSNRTGDGTVDSLNAFNDTSTLVVATLNATTVNDSYASADDGSSNTTGTRFVRKDIDEAPSYEDDIGKNATTNSTSDSVVLADNSTVSVGHEKDVRLLQNGEMRPVSATETVKPPNIVADSYALMANIQQILPIGPSNVRLQIAMSPSVMEMMFMDSDAVSVLYTNNLTSDLLLWHRHPLIIRHTVAFVTVDRSDVAAETVISDLQPNREYYFAVVIVSRKNQGHKVEFQRLGDVEATVTVQLEEGMCEFMGKTFGPGERLYDDCQAVCDCLPGQRVRCEALVCPDHLGPERSGCLEWYVDSAFIARAPHCCPDVACKYGSTCVYGGQKFRNLEAIPRNLISECDKECNCVAGNVTCSQRCPSIDVSVVPTDMGCDRPVLASNPGDDDDLCCRRWVCESDGDTKTLVNASTPSISTAVTSATTTTTTTTTTTVTVGTIGDSTAQDTPNGADDTSANGVVATHFSVPPTDPDLPAAQKQECSYENQTYRLNEQWKVGRGHRQKSCSCVQQQQQQQQPDGEPSVECQGGCPPILTHHLSLIPDCPPENVVIWDVPELCPYVVCNKTDIGRGVKNVTAVVLNATSMRIDFVLPNIYVGLYGHAEILYTMDLTHSEDTWSKEVFSGPSNQFESSRLTHEMNGLQPDTEYHLKVQVVIRNTKNVDSSDVITVRMPPLPTTTTTTTSTTLPPKISIDAQILVSEVQPTSAKVSWRAYNAFERRFIDGVQLQYRKRSGGDDNGGAGEEESAAAAAAAGDTHAEPFGQWSLTTLIHRDVTHMTLRDLKPDSDYDVDIVFVPPTNVTTEVLSFNSVGFHTLPIHDDFEFNLTLTVDKVTSQSVELIWTGVPYPEHKYVNVYRILFMVAGMPRGVEPMYVYRSPKGNQFQFTVDGLVPSTNYTVWMEAYLINGRTRASNNITVLTKVGPSVSKDTEKEKHESLGGTNGIGNHVDGDEGQDYAAALIVVGLIAALVTLGFVVLLVILLRKQSSAKAPITTGTTSPAVKSHSAYDNPTYKDSLD